MEQQRCVSSSVRSKGFVELYPGVPLLLSLPLIPPTQRLLLLALFGIRFLMALMLAVQRKTETTWTTRGRAMRAKAKRLR